MKLSDYVAGFLVEAGCDTVFGYPGGAITHLLDSICRTGGLRWVQTCHEQGAAFAAEGYARVRGGIGVAAATSGPGATNLITGIGSAYFDSIPCLYLTGQVNTYEYKGESRVRQAGFQETDIVGIVKPITKYAVRLTDSSRIRYELEKCVFLAESGRKGPVLLDLPMDLQRAEIEPETLEHFSPPESPAAEFDAGLAADWLKHSSRPVLLAGGGVRLSGARDLLRVFVRRLQLPVVSSLMGRDAYDNDSINYFGMAGCYGNRYANLALANSDLILAVGSRLDTRQTGTKVESFARQARLLRVEIDPAELERKVKPGECGVRADICGFLRTLLASPEILKMEPGLFRPWRGRLMKYRLRYPSFAEEGWPDPNFICSELSNMMRGSDIVCTDVGQNQMWAAQSMTLTGRQRMLTGGGMGAMGFALPAAVGACFAREREARVFALTGDGGFQMNLQELGMVGRERVPVKIIVLNNRSLGMIRQFQEMYFEGRYYGTVLGYEAPDFCRIARAYDIPAVRVETRAQFDALPAVFASDGPALAEIMLPRNTYVFPKLSVGRPIEDQDPRLPRGELEENMMLPLYP